MPAEEELFKEVKENELKITWNDEDSRIRSIIERGKFNLEELTGTSLDFTENNQAKSLLLDYCRYDYNNSTEYFEENFYREINRLQFQEAIKDAKKKG